MIKIISSLCLLGFFLTGFTAINSFASNGNLLISEIAYRGTVSQDNCKTSSSSTFNCNHDKWVEIYNPTTESINLSNYKLAYGNQGTGYTETRGLSGSIASYGYFVIGNKTNNSMTNLPSYDLTLPNLHFMSRNSGDNYLKVALMDSSSQVIDSVNLGDGAIAGLESGFDFAKSKFSIEFKDGSTQVNQSNSYGRSADYKNFGTPGYGFLVPITKSPEPEIKPVALISPIPVPVTPVTITKEIPIETSPIPTNVQPINTTQISQEARSQVSLESKVLNTVPMPISIESTTATALSATPTQGSVKVESVTQTTSPTPKADRVAIQSRTVAISQSQSTSQSIEDTVSQGEQSQSTQPISLTAQAATQATTTKQTQKQPTPITKATATAKVSQSSYELIMTLVAVSVAIFISYLVFDYNYQLIKQSNLDKFTNIVSY